MNSSKLTTSKLLLIIFSIILFFSFTYILTNGTMDLKEGEPFSRTYISILDNLLKGRFDIDPSAIGYEAFYRDGKTYTYFGIFPAILRGVIELMFKRGNTDWSRISTLLAATLAVIFSTITYFKVASSQCSNSNTNYFYTTLFALTIAFGSPITFLLSSAYIYHEAIMWGLAWSCMFIWSFISFSLSKKICTRYIFIMSVSCGFAMLSRISFSSITLGLMLLIGLMFFSGKLPTRLAPEITTKQYKTIILVAILPFILCLLVAMKVNYERFGEPFNFCKLEYYQHFINDAPQRLQGLKQWGIFNIYRIPFGIIYYFIPDKNHFINQFPFIKISDKHSLFDTLRYNGSGKLREVSIDGIERLNPLTVSSPAIVFFAFIGIFSLLNSGVLGIILILPFLLQSIFTLGTAGITLRYTAEFVPFLVVCSIYSFSLIKDLEKMERLPRAFIRTIAVLITLVGMYTSLTTMLQFKLDLWPVQPMAKANIVLFYSKVNQSWLEPIMSLISSILQYTYSNVIDLITGLLL